MTTKIWPAKRQKYILQLIHGASEHLGRYEEFISILNLNGITVYSDNLVSHGLEINSKEKVSFHSFTSKELIIRNLEVYQTIKDDFPNAIIILFGHSLGSFIAKFLVYNNLATYNKIILSGTNNPSKSLLLFSTGLLELSRREHISKLYNYIFFGSQGTKVKLKKYGIGWLSFDQENEKFFQDDPLSGNPFSNKALLSMMKILLNVTSSKTLNNFNDKQIPQLIIYGKKDPVSNFGKQILVLIKKQYKYNIYNQKIIGYDNSKHEILFDQQKTLVIKDVLEFISTN
ncbi:MAG: hypothetical protein GQ557_01650 [Mycoplasmataceae bacterium]|nr:hypothetical protein [Mycoplasmataceae bacterium]